MGNFCSAGPDTSKGSPEGEVTISRPLKRNLATEAKFKECPLTEERIQELLDMIAKLEAELQRPVYLVEVHQEFIAR